MKESTSVDRYGCSSDEKTGGLSRFFGGESGADRCQDPSNPTVDREDERLIPISHKDHIL